MAFSQYSKTVIHDDEPSTAGGSSSFSGWQHLLASNQRKRALGRVHVNAKPQRMIIKTPEKSSQQIPQAQRLTPETRSTSSHHHLMPQRAAMRRTPDKYPMPQRMASASMKTPEMPQLKTIKFSPSTARKKTRRSPSPPTTKARRSPSPRSRSKSTPPVMKRPPEVAQQRQQQPEAVPAVAAMPVDPKRQTITVNGKLYYVVDRIGKGASSDVFQVFQGSKMMAIKQVDLSKVSSAEASAFRNEVELLKRLRGNRRIVKLIDFEEKEKANGDGTELFVVMEHGERDLANLLREVSASENGLTDAKVKFYWEEMLEAVAVIHRENVVHTDLKPANFLIVGGMLKLIDFGIASTVADNETHMTKNFVCLGTNNYMSPEAIDGNAIKGEDGKPILKIGFKADVWSLGCILYYLVYKKMPFGDIKQPWMKLVAIKNPEHKINIPSDPASLNGHDPQVVDVLQRCLVRDPYNRASIKELLNHPYLKSDAAVTSNGKKTHLAVDQLLSAISTLTPNSKKVVMENLTNSSTLMAQPPPSYSQD